MRIISPFRRSLRVSVVALAAATQLVGIGVAAHAAGAQPLVRHADSNSVLPDPSLPAVFATSGGSSSGAPTIGWASSDWSGYAVTSRAPYRSVSAEWTVPAVVPSTGPYLQPDPSASTSFSAMWAGVDGFNNGDLLQAGTEQDVINGVPRYFAWFEALPNPETVIPSVEVRPGDRIFLLISRDAGTGTWSILMSDTSSDRGTQAAYLPGIGYSGPASSAEWIVEAPFVNGTTGLLANYGQATFHRLTTNGLNPHLQPSDAGAMFQTRSGTFSQVSTPSAPSLFGNAFSIAFGPVAPPPPTGLGFDLFGRIRSFVEHATNGVGAGVGNSTDNQD